MSDEESFVILGSCSPRNSLTEERLRDGFQSLEISKIEKDSTDNNDKTPETSFNDVSRKTESASGNTQIKDIKSSNETLTQSVNKQVSEPPQVEMVNDNSKSATINDMERSRESNKSIPLQVSTTNLDRSVGSGGSANGSLAASFIMGEVNADVLKSSVYSQFPSLCSMEACAEDVIKLQNFMSEYIELKSTLAKVNATMKQFYDKTQQWREEMQQTEQQYKLQLQNFHTQIAMLRNENFELKREMENRMQQMQLADELKKKEMSEMVQLISEKAALVDNLRVQIQGLENQNLVSYEYVPRNENDTKQNPEYIARSEHLLALKELERKLSEFMAENMELKEMQKVYVDEINCQKVNLISAEELIHKSRRDIDLLKASDLEKSERFIEYEKERDSMREEIALLRQQVDVYGKDFQMERTARENLAGEKDQLLQDLRAMQRTNQQLIEQQKRYVDSVMHANASTNTISTISTSSQNDASNNDVGNIAANQVSQSRFVAAQPTPAKFASNLHQRPIRPLPQPSPSNNRFHCPVCGMGYHSLSVLQSHVNSCLDNS